MKRKVFSVSVLAIFVLLNLSSKTFAASEQWPSKPISIYIGYAPGGGMDMMGRLLSEGMRKTLGAPLPVVNMTGANSATAMNHVYNQPRDGYTLFGISSGICGFPASGVSKLTYKDFGMIGIAFGSVPTFSVSYDSPIKTGKELIEKLKKGDLTASNGGTGGIWHIPQLVLADTIGAKFKAVPYNGGVPSAMAAAKKEVDFSTSDLSEALTLIKSDMLRPIMVYSDKPYTLGNVTIPPITEFVPEMKKKIAGGLGWRGLGYPRGIPQDRINKLIEAFKITMESDAAKEFATKNLLPIDGATGVDADRVFAVATQTQSWILYDIKEAKKNPKDLGIPKP